MRRVLIFVTTISILINTTTPTDDIKPIELRIRDFKHQIIEANKGNDGPHDSEVYKDIYDYVDNANKPVVPGSQFEKTQPEITFKRLEKLNSTIIEKNLALAGKKDDVGYLRIREHKRKKSKRSSKKRKNLEIFYRRTIFDGNARDRPQKWTHCLDLLSPFLNGFLNNVTETKRVMVTDAVIRRLTYLLGLNMSDASNDDIRATLYEISTLQLRMFQWDSSTIRHILNVITNDYRHDFKKLKYGIKALFAGWKLNTSNITRLFTQARIFRPPCLQITPYGGSTVTPRHDHSRFTKKPSNPSCIRRNEDDEDCLDTY